METETINETQELSALTAFRTLQTCGEACWSAVEDVCRCYCGGSNHGILKTKNGVAPTRMAKIDGHMYQIKSIGSYNELYSEAKKVNDESGQSYGVSASGESYPYRETDRGAPARLKAATQDQTQRWHEFSRFKGMDRRQVWQANGCTFLYILWVKL